MDTKKILLTILDFLRYQVDNDKCTSEEMKSILDTVSESMIVSATLTTPTVKTVGFLGQARSNLPL